MENILLLSFKTKPKSLQYLTPNPPKSKYYRFFRLNKNETIPNITAKVTKITEILTFFRQKNSNTAITTDSVAITNELAVKRKYLPYFPTNSSLHCIYL